MDIPREEPEKIKRWREEQKKRLEKKGKHARLNCGFVATKNYTMTLKHSLIIITLFCSDEEEEKKKKEMREAARKELEEWYRTHEDQVAKNRNANR